MTFCYCLKVTMILFDVKFLNFGIAVYNIICFICFPNFVCFEKLNFCVFGLMQSMGFGFETYSNLVNEYEFVIKTYLVCVTALTNINQMYVFKSKYSFKFNSQSFHLICNTKNFGSRLITMIAHACKQNYIIVVLIA